MSIRRWLVIRRIAEERGITEQRLRAENTVGAGGLETRSSFGERTNIAVGENRDLERLFDGSDERPAIA